MKKLWIALLAFLSLFCITLGAACVQQPTGPKLAFNEGYMEEVLLGEPIMLDEYINPLLTNDYTAILTDDETGQERDLKMLGQWTTDKPGTYTLVYTVNSGEYKGTVSTKITVNVPKVKWSYSRPTLMYRVGDTMPFGSLQRNLNIYVKSYYSYQFFVKTIMFNGNVVDVSDKNSYTFTAEGDHVVKFAIRTEDGQELSADQKLTVRPQQVLAAGAQEWMQENNITTHDYTYIEPNGRVTLEQATTSMSGGIYAKDNVPYLAFNGEEGTTGYGPETYMMVEFTGKNLPQVAFFCDDVQPTLFDKSNGVLLFNSFAFGAMNKEPHPSRMTVFGPKKVSYSHFDNKGRLVTIGSATDPCPASWNALDENAQYRYIVGIEDAKKTSMVVRVLLINLTTNERVWDYTQKVDRWVGDNGGELLNVDMSYYTGSIVLYSSFVAPVELDKVYMPITGIDSIYELDKAAAFRTDFKKTYDLGATANITDYINPTDFYTFTVTDPEGELVNISADGSFTYEKSGTYRLYYEPQDTNVRPSSTTVKVMYDFFKPFADDFFESEAVIVAAAGTLQVIPNTLAKYTTEGKTSIEYYTAQGIQKGSPLDIAISKEFTDFVFMAKHVRGISFKVYSAVDMTFALKKQVNTVLKQDYTGVIPAETWTTITIPRELILVNFESYKGAAYAIALSLYREEKFAQFDCVYIDDIQLMLDTPTVSATAQTFMTENNMTAYGYKSINDDLSVNLYEGTYDEEWYTVKNDNIPYVAYQGGYGAGSYVVVDFTGKNIPQLCFFAKEITSSITDGKAGIYVHTGMIKKNGDTVSPHDGGRVTFLGPNKMQYRRPDSDGRLGQFGYQTNNPTPTPFSIDGLQDGVHYRYVIGIKSAAAGSIVFDLMLINLDTNTKVAAATHTATGTWTADYITGNIVMYGRMNTSTKLDKIYPVYTGVSDINSIDKVSSVLGA